MIVKKIRNGDSPKTKAQQIADLVNYIRHPQGINPDEKVEHSGGWNFITDDHDGQRMEAIALAEDAIRSKMPVSHYVFSWRQYEQPTPGQVDELVDIFLREMGLEGCQTIYGLHHNTQNYHVHIAVNRMHPVTMKVINPNRGFDIEAAHKILALVEHRQGWTSETNARYVVNEQGEVVRKERKSGPKPKTPALDYEVATGAKSAQRIAQERGFGILENATSWSELHEKLAAVGLRFERKGSGAIIFVGEIAIKASSVDRAFSMNHLNKRLGDFVPGAYPDDILKIEPEPVSPINLKEWQQYRAETAPPPPVPQLVMQDIVIELLKVRQRKEQKNLPTRLAESLPPSESTPGYAQKCPRPILNTARHFQKLQHQEERRQLRRKVPRRGQQRPRFETWLRTQGLPEKAEQWRYRQKLENLPPNMWEAPPLPEDKKYAPLEAYATYRQGILKNDPELAHSPSMLDAVIAMYMRGRGFSRDDVEKAIEHCAPEAQTGQEARDWQRYAKRTASYAFSLPGDIWLAKRAELRKQKEEVRREETVVETPRLRMR